MEQIQAGFGLWICDTRKAWDLGKPYYAPEEFAWALGYAFELSDKYVWIYHQRIQPWGLDHPSQVKFPAAYWEAIRRVATPYRTFGPDYRHRRPPPSPALHPEPASQGTLVCHWPLRDSLENRIAGTAIQPPPAHTFSEEGRPNGFQISRRFHNLSIRTADLPGGLGRNATPNASSRNCPGRPEAAGRSGPLGD